MDINRSRMEFQREDDQFQETRSKNRINKKIRNQDRTKITLKERCDQRDRKIKEMDFQKRTVNSKWIQYQWIVYVYCSVITARSSYRYESSRFMSKPGSDTKKTLSRPLPKIRGNGVATRVSDVYTQGKYPAYTR